MAKYPTDEIGRTAVLKPTAAPVDTFIRAPVAEKSGLHDLAEGLGDLNGGLMDWMQGRKAEQEKVDAAQAEADFYTKNAAGDAEAIRGEPSFAMHSPIYQRTYKKLQGDALGSQYQTDLMGAWTMHPLHESDDPNAFNTFQQEYTRQWLSDHNVSDPFVIHGMSEKMQAANENVRSNWEKQRGERIYGHALTATSATINANVDAAKIDGITAPEGTDYEHLWGVILKNREEAVSVGVRSADIDKQIFESIAAKAIETKDPNLLKLLDKEIPGQPGVKYSDTPEGQKLKQDTTEKLEIIATRAMTEDRAREERLELERYNTNTGHALELIAKDPDAVIPEDILGDMSKHDPFIRTKLAEARRNLAQGNPEDKSDVLLLQRQIMAGGGTKAIQDALAAGIIRDPSTLSSMLEFAKKYDQNAKVFDDLMETPVAKNVLNTIKGQTAPGTSPEDIGVMQATGGMSPEGLEADLDYRNLMLEWLGKNPNASEADKMMAAAQIGKQVLSNIKEGNYTAPAEAGGQERNPYRPDPAAPPPGAPPTPDDVWSVPKPQDDRVHLWSGTQPPSIDALDPQSRATIEAVSKQLGLPPEQVIKRFWEKNRNGQVDQGKTGQNDTASGGAQGEDSVTGSIGNDTTGGTGGIEPASFQPGGDVPAKPASVLAALDGQPTPGDSGQASAGQGDAGGGGQDGLASLGGSTQQEIAGGVDMSNLAPKVDPDVGGGPAIRIPIKGKSFEEKAPGIMQNLMADYDLTREQAAGIVGNMGHESVGFSKLQEIKPTVKGSRGGWGWAQWTGPRRRLFEKKAAQWGLDPTSDEMNYRFLRYELENTEKGALKRLRKATTVKEAMVAFEAGFERAGVKHYKSREKYSNIAFNSFGGGGSTGKA